MGMQSENSGPYACWQKKKAVHSTHLFQLVKRVCIRNVKNESNCMIPDLQVACKSSPILHECKGVHHLDVHPVSSHLNHSTLPDTPILAVLSLKGELSNILARAKPSPNTDTPERNKHLVCTQKNLYICNGVPNITPWTAKYKEEEGWLSKS